MNDKTNIIDILKIHAVRYPLMEPADAVKLVFQSEFGGGHLIKDAESCRRRLYEEFEKTAHDERAELCERIGGGFVRVNLAAVDGDELELLLRAFIDSSGTHHGDTDRFERALREMCGRFGEIGFSFTEEELASYIREYKKAGVAPVSHSERYRAAYRPAYRVVHESSAARYIICRT